MIVLSGGEVVTGAGKRFRGDVVIDGGKIVDVGPDVDGSGCDVVDVSGRSLYPGLIDAHTHLGLDETGRWEGVNELNEIGKPITPHLRAVDGFYYGDETIVRSVAAGVLTVMVMTGSIQVLSGQPAVMKLGVDKHKMVMVKNAGIKGGMGENPIGVYRKRGQFPSTRMGVACAVREAFHYGCRYRDGWSPQGSDWTVEMLESLQPVLRGEVPWRAHAHRADDIMTAVRIASEFGVKLVIEHGTEAPLVAEELAQAGVMVVIGPGGFVPGIKQESSHDVLPGLRDLVDAGVCFSFTTDHPVVDLPMLPVMVSSARKYLDEEQVLQAVSLDAASICGVEHRVGSVEAGKDADIVVMRGSLFDPGSVVEAVIVEGRVSRGELDVV